MFNFHYDGADYYLFIRGLMNFYEIDIFKNGSDVDSAELLISVGASKGVVDWHDCLLLKDRDKKYYPTIVINSSYRGEDILPEPVRIFVEQSYARYFNLLVFS